MNSEQLELDLRYPEVDVDGYVDKHGFAYIGKAQMQHSGRWRVLANIAGTLSIVEVKLTFLRGKS